MVMQNLIHKLNNVFDDFIPLSSESPKQRGKYYVFESLDLGIGRTMVGNFKLLIAFNTLDKDMNAGLKALDETISKILKNQAIDGFTRLFFDGLKLSFISEGLFVYEIHISIKVAL